MGAALVSLIVGGLTAVGANAQTAPPPTPPQAGAAATTAPIPEGPAQVSEVLVTANKRSERVQEVPVAVTVVSGEQLTRQNITNITDLSRAVPALTSTLGPAGSIQIRGVGTLSFAQTSEASVGLYLDNVSVANTSPSFAPAALFDVQRVEVLEGPQGTLFGRNASAGVLNVTTNEPKFGRWEASAHADIGTRDSQIVQAVVNAPIGDDAALRIAGHLTRFPQAVFSIPGHEWNQDDDEGVRARFRWKPTADLSVNLIADYNKVHQRNDTWAVSSAAPGSFLANQLSACGVAPSNTNNVTCENGGVHGTTESFGASAQIDYSLGGYTLTSISSYRVLTTIPGGNLDSDSVPTNVLDINYNHSNVHNVSQELRLTSPANQRLEYVLGFYYFRSGVSNVSGQDGTLNVPILLLLNRTAGQTGLTKAETRSLAGFGQATLHVTDKARLIFGGRIDDEDVSADTVFKVYPGALAPYVSSIAPVSARATDTDFSFRAGGQYDVLRDVMAYVTYTRGYKGPSVNDQSTTLNAPLVVQPELPHAYELGVKSSLFDKRLALDLTLFHTDTDNFQATIFDVSSASYIFGNAPSLTTQGVELSVFGRPIPDLTINGGVTYVDATYGKGYFVPCGPTQTAAQGCVTTTVKGVASSSADAGGARLLGSPEWKAVLSGEYEHALTPGVRGYVQLDGVYTSRISYTPSNYDPLDSRGDYFVLGGRFGVRTSDGRYGLAVYGRNLTDERIPAFVIDTPASDRLGDTGSHSRYFGPDSYRTVGVSLDARF